MTRERTGRHWPWIIVGLLVGHVSVMVLLIVTANAGESHAVEPNYYQKALDWDQTMAQQRANVALGWELREQASMQHDAVWVRASLFDRDGKPLTGAKAELITFHRAHSNDRLELSVPEVAPGVYAIHWPTTHAGLWEMRWRFTAGEKRFTRTDVIEVFAPEPGR